MLDLVISGPTANEAWIALIRRIYEDGAESRPRNLRIKELTCWTTQVDMRYPVVTVKRRKMGYRFMVAEAWWILTGRNDVMSLKSYSPHIASFSNDGYRFDGAYGPKVVDQLRYVVDTLERDPDSRQAVVSIWRSNPRDSKDVPCTLTLQWLIRDGKLHCVDTMRSSDAWLGWPYDVFNFSMLSAYVLLMLREREHLSGGFKHTGFEFFNKIGLGALYLVAGSSHLYVNPKEDGATNVPYAMEDVQGILEAYGCVAPASNDGRILLPYLEEWLIEYAPLNIDEFTSPGDLVRHLELVKDRQDSGHQWLRELLLEEKKL